MRILIYGINFIPELTGTGKYTGEMASWLVVRGHQIRVVTAPPYYPKWRIGKGYSTWRYRKELLAENMVWRCPLWIPKKPKGFTRLIHLLSFGLSSTPVMLTQAFWKPDVIILIAPTLLCAPGAWLTARLSGSTAWLHIQDFELDVALGLGLLGSGPIGRVALAFERWALRRFDRVSTISQRMLHRLQDKGVSETRRVLLPNWVNVDVIHPAPAASPFRAELGIPVGIVVALYAGNMGEKQGLGILVDAARSMQDDRRMIFVLAGAGAARERLERASEGLPNIRWLALQPVERLNDLLNLADIHLLPQRKGAADLVMPSKLTGMLATGRPIVATAEQGTQVAITVEPCGRVVPPGDVVALAQALVELGQDAETRHVLGRKAREYAVEHLSVDSVLSKLETELQKLANQHNGGNRR